MADKPYGTPDVGRLRNRLTWQSFGGGPLDSMNQPGQIWVTQSVGIPAHVEPLSGRELFNAKQLKATTSHKVRIRNVGAVAPSDRFLLEDFGTVLGIDSVYAEDSRNRYLILMCSELKSPQ
jgi:head-tail adaptor